MTDVDTSAEAVERLIVVSAGYIDRVADNIPATLRALAAERDALQEVVDVRTMIGTARLEEDRDRLAAENARLRAALEIIAGKRQCIDNLMGDKDVARAALAGDTSHG